MQAGCWQATPNHQRSAPPPLQPPTSAPVTVEVEQGDLTDQITATGVITGAQDSAVNLPATSADSVVTAVNVKAGEQLENTQVVAWINDRPSDCLSG